MDLLAWTISMIASLLLMISTLAFLRSNDIFTMAHVVMIANCYIVPLLLIAAGIENFSWTSAAKIVFIILLNIIIANLLCHITLEKASLDKITPDVEAK